MRGRCLVQVPLPRGDLHHECPTQSPECGFVVQVIFISLSFWAVRICFRKFPLKGVVLK